MLNLSDWGVVQIVGRSMQDPITPGPSALRLTYCGRVGIGLSPSIGIPNQDVGSPRTQSWNILHSASKERLIYHCGQINPAVHEHHLVAQKGSDSDIERL